MVCPRTSRPSSFTQNTLIRPGSFISFKNFKKAASPCASLMANAPRHCSSMERSIPRMSGPPYGDSLIVITSVAITSVFATQNQRKILVKRLWIFMIHAWPVHSSDGDRSC